jgi:type IV pilus assembly protein PilV
VLRKEHYMNRQNSLNLKSNQQGVVLLEALIAVLIFSMGILALVGLQATMIKSTTGSKFRSDASYIAQQRIGRIWADPANAATYVVVNQAIPELLPNGLVTITQPQPSQFRVTVGWTEPGETAVAGSTTSTTCGMTVAHCFTTVASIAGG